MVSLLAIRSFSEGLARDCLPCGKFSPNSPDFSIRIPAESPKDYLGQRSTDELARQLIAPTQDNKASFTFQQTDALVEPAVLY